MLSYLSSPDPRRAHNRVVVESLCSEYSDLGARHGLVVDVSPDGLRMQRPIGGPRTRLLQLEFELPEIDEIIWAQGEICFDQVWQMPRSGATNLSGLIRTSGIRIVSAARQHRRMLRDYVVETQRAIHERETEWFYRTTRYR